MPTRLLIVLIIYINLVACNDISKQDNAKTSEKPVAIEQTQTQAQAKTDTKPDKKIVMYQQDPMPPKKQKSKDLVCPWLSKETAKDIIVESTLNPIKTMNVVQIFDENSGYNYVGCVFEAISLYIYSEKDGQALIKRWKAFKHPSTFVAQDGPGTNAMVEYPSLLNKKGLKKPTSYMFNQAGKAIFIHMEMPLARATVASLRKAADEVSKNL